MAAHTTRLNLKTRDEFAGLSLYDKNAYLQDVARQVVEAGAKSLCPR